MKLRNISFLTSVIRPRRKILTEESITQLQNEVNSLADLFAKTDFKVYLVGGIGMALREKEFYRNHCDIDIAIFHEDLEKMINHLHQQGYSVMTRYFSMHISPWHNWQMVSKFNQSGVNGADPGELRIRVLKCGNTFFRHACCRTDYFDVFFLGSKDEGVELHGYRSVVPWSDFLPEITVKEGSNLFLPNLNYKRYLPPLNEKEKIDFRKAGIVPIYSS